MTKRKTWEEVKAARKESPEERAGYEAARRAVELGEMVRARREALGITQTELATRVGTRQPAIARLEAGGSVPSIDLLDRVANALDAALTVEFRTPKQRSA
jgi:HTH-type transcriptional regulator/antitoxin HipB